MTTPDDGAANPVSRLGIRLRTRDMPVGVPVAELAGLALRRNPRRAHLLVSTVLGKHVPTDPRVVTGAALLLGLLVDTHLADAQGSADLAGLGQRLSQALREPDETSCAALHHEMTIALAGRPVPQQRRVVMSYAETATALGAGVAAALRADHLHSTRRQVAGIEPLGGFEESHSHATSHLITPMSPHFLSGDGPLILVDDELTTGATAFNTIAALHRQHPRSRYVIACLLDMRSPADTAALQERAAELGVELSVVALAAGEVELPAGTQERATELVAQLTDQDRGTTPPRAQVSTVSPPWPAELPEGGRHGITVSQQRQLDSVVSGVAQEVSQALGTGDRDVLVLGTEEFMATPLALAQALTQERPSSRIRFSTTTRSPVLACDVAGYPIRTMVAFQPPEPDETGAQRFAYNIPGAGAQDIVLVVDPPAAGESLWEPGGLVDALRPHAERVMVLVLGQVDPAATASRAPRTPVLRGPQFGSYPRDDVAWLLKDLSGVQLEAPTADRERAIQSGQAHYAESLPEEFQPSAQYTELFHAALQESADRLATAVGVVGEILLAERGPELVLASLARAGTPVGVLLRRWLRFAHGLDVPHYALSIVRARGIDDIALDHLASQHDPAGVVFVDGWTGKGAIIRELTVALQTHNATHGTAFNPDLAVLADPGECVRTFGTREDFLIPSACLNSTVSGLVSRTVLNDELIGPRDFHGAKFYAELAAQDVSNLFVDSVAERFSAVQPQVVQQWRAVLDGPREPTWSGWAAVERISHDYGVGDVNFVKPGVGETTRVLLRRVPDRILMRPDREADLRHVLLLAQQRGVPVEQVVDLPYSCVGLIARTGGGEG